MSSAVEYRLRADESETLARMMSRNDHRRHFLEVARELRSIAEAIEASERVDAEASNDAADRN